MKGAKSIYNYFSQTYFCQNPKKLAWCAVLMMALYLPALVKKVWVSFSEGVRFHFSLYCKASTNKTSIGRHHFLYKPVYTRIDFATQNQEFVIDRYRKSSEIVQKTHGFGSYIFQIVWWSNKISGNSFRPSSLFVFWTSGKYISL